MLKSLVFLPNIHQQATHGNFIKFFPISSAVLEHYLTFKIHTPVHHMHHVNTSFKKKRQNSVNIRITKKLFNSCNKSYLYQSFYLHAVVKEELNVI